jgi:hypothetical protein
MLGTDSPNLSHQQLMRGWIRGPGSRVRCGSTVQAWTDPQKSSRSAGGTDPSLTISVKDPLLRCPRPRLPQRGSLPTATT